MSGSTTLVAQGATDRVAEAPAEGMAEAGLHARAQAAFARYAALCDKAEAFAQAGDLDSAASYAAIAAQSAVRPHAGFYLATRLERLLVEIGRTALGPGRYRRPPPGSGRIEKVLHVGTTVGPVGGLRNLLRHWIAVDSGRRHSLALTQHSGPVIDSLARAVSDSGGSIYKLNRMPGGFIAWARELRRIAEGYDAVVLHLYSQDPTGVIAFADPLARPPVILDNHGDHLMWLGASVSDVVLNLRDAAQDLTIARRGVAPERNVMVPTIVSPTERTRSRAQAKAELGLDPNSVFLFSAARPMKYRTVDGVSFADTHVELLKRHPEAVFWVLGAGEPEDWRAASAAVGGRLRGLAESPQPQVYFEAADIYVDSYPFVSSTSLMEAAGYGAPLVSRFYGPKAAEIFAINHPGLKGSVLNASSEAEYLEFLETLISDPDRRERLGEQGRRIVREVHCAPGWMTFLERAYALAEQIDPVDPKAMLAKAELEAFSYGEPDRRLYEVFGLDDEPIAFIKPYVRTLAFAERVRLWSELKSKGAFSNLSEAVRHLAPEWLIQVLKDRRLGSLGG